MTHLQELYCFWQDLSLVIACTATASVGQRMAAIANAAPIGKSGQIQ